MKTAFTTLALLVALTLTSRVQAQAQEQEPELYKDPLIALYLSATLPGLGQFYTDDKKRGLLFFTSIVGAFGSAYAFYSPADLELADYDKTNFGGNADGLISTTEAQNWEDEKFEDDAFDQFKHWPQSGCNHERSRRSWPLHLERHRCAKASPRPQPPSATAQSCRGATNGPRSCWPCT